MKTFGVNVAAMITSIGFCAFAAFANDGPKRPIDGIMDNSFLIEEAYNQEPGVVQHIFNGLYSADKPFAPDEKRFDFSFTQEWPVVSQAHQFSYTVPYSFDWTGTPSSHGIGDVLLNYRYQAYLEEKSLTAFSPRFSLVLPTGDASRGFGNSVVGYQWNLPFSTTFNERWFVHANAGLTYLPEVGAARHDVLNYNVGASAIYCVNDRFNLMLETLGLWTDIDRTPGWRHEFSVIISPGARYAFNLDSGAQIVVGLAAPCGVTGSAPDVGAFLYFSFESQLWGPKDK